MSLFRNGLLNRLSQLTCLVIPKHPGAFGCRYITSESDRGSEDSADTVNKDEVITEEETHDIPGGGPGFERFRDEDMLVPGAYFPTEDIFETTYDGIKFGDLPCVSMVFTRNNVKMGAHSADGKTNYGSKTCGIMGFKNAEKRSTVAAQTTGYALGDDIVRKNVKHVRVELYGQTVARLPAMMGLQQAGVNIVSISDRTSHSFYTRPRHPKKKLGDWGMDNRPQKQITD